MAAALAEITVGFSVGSNGRSWSNSGGGDDIGVGVGLLDAFSGGFGVSEF